MKYGLLVGAILAVTIAACGKKEEAPPLPRPRRPKRPRPPG